MFILKLFHLLVLCNINSIRTKEPEITLSVLLTKGTRSPWGLVKTEKAIEIGNRKLRELLAGLATIKSHTVTSQYIGCSKTDIGALGAELYHVGNTSVFIGPGKSSYKEFCCSWPKDHIVGNITVSLAYANRLT